MAGKKYDTNEIKTITALYANTPSVDIANKLGITLSRVYSFAFKQGLKKSPAYFLSDACGRLTTGKVIGYNTQYKKGHTPKNKGKKQSEYMSAAAIQRTTHTRFKKGQAPHNTNAQGDGAILIRTDKNSKKYKYIRLSLGLWVPYHQHLWWQANGKYNSRSHCLWFINGNSLDVRLDNLELITRAENALRNRNKFKALPQPLQQTKKLLNKLKNKIHATKNI